MKDQELFDIQTKHVNGGGWQTVHPGLSKDQVAIYWPDHARSTKTHSYRLAMSVPPYKVVQESEPVILTDKEAIQVLSEALLEIRKQLDESSGRSTRTAYRVIHEAMRKTEYNREAQITRAYYTKEN